MLQGGWETDETAEEAAARETMEEAGVKGELQASLSPFLHVPEQSSALVSCDLHQECMRLLRSDWLIEHEPLFSLLSLASSE